MFFAQRKFNSVADYTRYRNTRAYIDQKYRHFVDGPEFGSEKEALKSLCSALGYKNFNKLNRRLTEWHSLTKAVPVEYFKLIDLSERVLNFVVELDSEEYEYALATPVEMQHFLVRYLPTAYEEVTMPPTTDETEAINYIQAYQKERPFPCIINITDIKTIHIPHDGEIKHFYYYPEVKKVDNHYIFTSGNRGIGVTKVG